MNTFSHINQIGYSDIEPVEVMKHVTESCVIARRMSVARVSAPHIVPGGFAWHCTNNNERQQVWTITSDGSEPEFRVRLHKNGQWKDAHGNRYLPADHARKFYDDNF